MKKICFLAIMVALANLSIAQKNVGIGTSSPLTKLDVAGALSLREGVSISLSNGGTRNGSNDTITLPYISGTTDIASYFHITGPTAAFSIYGIKPATGANGQIVTLVNHTGYTMTIINENSYAAGDSIYTQAGGNLVDDASSTQGSSITLQYSQNAGGTGNPGWVVISTENFRVTNLQGNPVSSTTPTTSQVLQWNGSSWVPSSVVGPSGATGPTGTAGTNGTNGTNGAAGATGPAGPTGATGSNGSAGATGPAGPTGSAGTNGTNGAAGATGPAGPTGAAGSNGAAGATGPAGPTGSAGTNGTNGAAGATGPAGPTGAAGSNGAAGATGPAGAAGSTGANGAGYYATSSSSQSIVSSGSLTFVTQSGLAYVAGDRVRIIYTTTITDYMEGTVTSYSGTSMVVSITNSNGSGGPFTSWDISLTGIVGSTGATGSNGTNGTNGAAGATGPAGPTGAAGTNGTNGTNGSNGATGPTGFLSNGTATGVTPYWNGSSWVVSSTNIYNDGGIVGIGSTSAISNFANEELVVGGGLFQHEVNSQSYPYYDGSGGWAAGWNTTGGGAEVDFWNVYNGAATPAGFNFYQQTSASSKTLLMSIAGQGSTAGAVSIPGNLAEINTVSYVWPTTQGSSGQVLTDNGSGTLSWANPSNNVVQEQVFTYTDGLQAFIVPPGVTTITVYMWGAGGGAGGLYSGGYYSASGGPGGFVSGNLTVTPGQLLQILVGGGGYYFGNYLSYGGGGVGGGTSSSQIVGAGGGMSALLNSSGTYLAIAGGGGGGGGAPVNSSGTLTNGGGYGGAGGGTTGGNGGSSPYTTHAANGGAGGTQAAGGAGGTGYGANGTAGSQYQGGNGGDGSGDYPSGGGGGGYYGGGGGGSYYGAGGGGGSSYTGGLNTSPAPTNTQGTAVATGAAAPPPQTTNAYYLTGVGTGGHYNSNYFTTEGGNGEVVITW